MNKQSGGILLGGVIVFIALGIIIYFLFFNKKSNSADADRTGLSGVFDSFFKTMDEKYTLKSRKTSTQLMESVVMNTLKVFEEFLNLPDINYAMNNVFENTNAVDINDKILSPFFDCLKSKIRAVAANPVLNDKWIEQGEMWDWTVRDSSKQPIYVNKLLEKGEPTLKSCLKKVKPSNSIMIREANNFINNMNEYNNKTEELIPEGTDLIKLLNRQLSGPYLQGIFND